MIKESINAHSLDLGYFRERTGVNSRDKRIDILSQKDGH